MEAYQILGIAFYVCIAIAVLFFIITLLLFFLFDVRAIVAARTGKMKAKTIQEMEEATGSTGRLLQKKKETKKTGKLQSGKTVVKKGIVQSPGELDGSAVTAKIKGADNGSEPDGDDTQTEVLRTDRAETSVLGADRAETSVLDSPTQRLGESETTVLVQSASVPVVEGIRFEIVKKVVCRDTEETA